MKEGNLNYIYLMILGLINQKEQSAYDVLKEIYEMGIHSMFCCGESTVYIYCKKLAKKGFIEPVESEEKGRKVIYRITEQGRKNLEKEIEQITAEYRFEDAGFSIAVIFLDIFDDKKAGMLLKQRIVSIRKTIECLEERKAGVKNLPGLPEFHTQCIERLIELAKGELEGTGKIKKAFQQKGKM